MPCEYAQKRTYQTNAFFQENLKKMNLTLVMWCIIAHPSAFAPPATGRNHPLRPPGARLRMKTLDMACVILEEI
jgi:hypothetical protein